jgi:hypothetical protein
MHPSGISCDNGILGSRSWQDSRGSKGLLRIWSTDDSAKPMPAEFVAALLAGGAFPGWVPG